MTLHHERPAAYRRSFLKASCNGFSLGVAAAVFLVFVPATFGGFLNWDDGKYTFDNPLVRDGLSLKGMNAAFANSVFGFWAPLTILSYQLDVAIFGMRPFGFHLTNVVLHAAAAGLLCLAFTRMTGKPLRSAAASALFAVHPLRVESVAWIAERKDVLAMLFITLTLVAYERYCRRPSAGRYMAVVAGLLAGLMSKATVVTLPVLLLVLDWWPLGRFEARGSDVRGPSPRYPVRTIGQLVMEKIPLMFMAALFAGFTLITHRRSIETRGGDGHWMDRFVDACVAFQWLVGKTLFPAGLHPVQRPPAGGWPAWLAVSAVGIAAGWLLAIAVTARRKPAIACGLAWFFMASLPMLGLLGKVGVSPYADRFTYVPHVGLMLAVVWTAADLTPVGGRWRWLAPAVFAAVAAVWIALDEAQIRHWSGSESLWQHVLAIDEENLFAHTNFGTFLAREGRLDEAIPHFERALQLDSTDPLARRNLAKALEMRETQAPRGRIP